MYTTNKPGFHDYTYNGVAVELSKRNARIKIYGLLWQFCEVSEASNRPLPILPFSYRQVFICKQAYYINSFVFGLF
jgi:hypothetical protein